MVKVKGICFVNFEEDKLKQQKYTLYDGSK